MKNNFLDLFRDPPGLRHLKRLTTPTGVIQHADFDVPDPAHGYSIDDNARALIVCLWHYRLFQDASVLSLAEVYFNYLQRVEKEGGSFHNFLSFSEKLLESEGSEDSIGRAIWVLGEVMASHADKELTEKANEIFSRASIEKHLDHPHVRTKAYILLGLLAAGKLDEAKRWTDKLVAIFNNQSTDDWLWFEDGLFYANGILPYALARAARILQDQTAGEVAIKSFDWLDSLCRLNGQPSPVGQNGWFFKNGQKATYDQQPLEAADMVLAATELYLLTDTQKYLNVASDWFGWYKGNNSQEKSLIDETTGGIYDAVTPGGVNKNQGAESIVTYLLAYLSIAELTKNDRTN